MKELRRNREAAHSSGEHKPREAAQAGVSPSPKAKRRRWPKILGIFILVLVVCAIAARAAMPWAVRKYVNATLDKNPLYSGRIGKVGIRLWRGAYSIDDVRLSKTTDQVPVPLFSGNRVEFSIQWHALMHGKIVGRVVMIDPQVNFVDTPSGGQTGANGPWLEMIQDLFPFQINSAIIKNGSVHFRSYVGQKPVDIYLSELNASVENLSNIRNETTPLNATVEASAKAMDTADFQLKMTLDPFSYRPTFHLATRLLGLDVTKLNDLVRTYGDFDFKHGWFDLVLEADAKEGLMTGYIKPLFRDLKIFSLKKDLKEDTVVQFFWKALLGATTTIFKNAPRDQFGTLIPFTGDLTGATSAQILTAIGNVLRNAFVRAYLPRLEGQESFDGMSFQAPNVSAPISPMESQ